MSVGWPCHYHTLKRFLVSSAILIGMLSPGASVAQQPEATPTPGRTLPSYIDPGEIRRGIPMSYCTCQSR